LSRLDLYTLITLRRGRGFHRSIALASCVRI
jgi:hypothetical protein